MVGDRVDASEESLSDPGDLHDSHHAIGNRVDRNQKSLLLFQGPVLDRMVSLNLLEDVLQQRKGQSLQDRIVDDTLRGILSQHPEDNLDDSYRQVVGNLVSSHNRDHLTFHLLHKDNLADRQGIQEEGAHSLGYKDSLLIRYLGNDALFLDMEDLLLVPALEQYNLPQLKNRGLASNWFLALFCVHNHHIVQGPQPLSEDHSYGIYQKNLACALLGLFSRRLPDLGKSRRHYRAVICGQENLYLQ